MSGLRMRVACDTPLGVEFATLEAKGRGVLIVERLVEKFAEARGWKPEECEPLLVEDAETRRIMWRHDASGETRDVERVFFQCPACGRSFAVRSETSKRIFCGGPCARATRRAASGSAGSDTP